jgi:hypothetical protein
VREFPAVSLPTFVKPLCVSHFFGSDWMRPRITKSKSRGGFLGDELVGRFDNRAKWVTQLAGVFPVGVVNAPELLAGLQTRARFHGDSSPETKRAKMYQLHKMRAQSAGSPMSGQAKTKGCTAESVGQNGAFLHLADESVTRGDRRRRELEARSSSPPLACLLPECLAASGGNQWLVVLAHNQTVIR